MIRRNKLNTTAITAITAAILCSSPISFAQETAPVVTTQPAAPAPVEAPPVDVQAAPEVAPVSTTVAPPPAVRTIPDSALGQPVASNPEPRTAASERPAPRRAVASQKAAPRAVEPSPVASPAVATTADADFAPASDDMELSDVAGENTDIAVPLNQSEGIAQAGAAQEDWLVYGSLAAALGLAGLGGVVASRRRRARDSGVRSSHQSASVAVPANNPAIRPIAAGSPVVQMPASQPAVADGNLPPVTDPLFAHRTELGPITDPLFSQQVTMPPVTDPMFAEHGRYAGNSSDGSAFDKRRDLASTTGNHNVAVREVEPAG